MIFTNVRTGFDLTLANIAVRIAAPKKLTVKQLEQQTYLIDNGQFKGVAKFLKAHAGKEGLLVNDLQKTVERGGSMKYLSRIVEVPGIDRDSLTRAIKHAKMDVYYLMKLVQQLDIDPTSMEDFVLERSKQTSQWVRKYDVKNPKEFFVAMCSENKYDMEKLLEKMFRKYPEIDDATIARGAKRAAGKGAIEIVKMLQKRSPDVVPATLYELTVARSKDTGAFIAMVEETGKRDPKAINIALSVDYFKNVTGHQWDVLLELMGVLGVTDKVFDKAVITTIENNNYEFFAKIAEAYRARVPLELVKKAKTRLTNYGGTEGYEAALAKLDELFPDIDPDFEGFDVMMPLSRYMKESNPERKAEWLRKFLQVMSADSTKLGYLPTGFMRTKFSLKDVPEQDAAAILNAINKLPAAIRVEVLVTIGEPVGQEAVDWTLSKIISEGGKFGVPWAIGELMNRCSEPLFDKAAKYLSKVQQPPPVSLNESNSNKMFRLLSSEDDLIPVHGWWLVNWAKDHESKENDDLLADMFIRLAKTGSLRMNQTTKFYFDYHLNRLDKDKARELVQMIVENTVMFGSRDSSGGEWERVEEFIGSPLGKFVDADKIESLQKAIDESSHPDKVRELYQSLRHTPNVKWTNLSDDLGRLTKIMGQRLQQKVDDLSKQRGEPLTDEQLQDMKDEFSFPLQQLQDVNPQLRQRLRPLAVFGDGKPVTFQMISDFTDTLEDFDVPIERSEFTLNAQRSLSKRGYSKVAQIVLKVMASDRHIEQMQDAGVFELFQGINKRYERGSHPYAPMLIGWIRLDVSLDKQYLLVDEVQSDIERDCFLAQRNPRPYVNALPPKKTLPGQTISPEDQEKEVVTAAKELTKIVRHFPDMAVHIVTDFARTNGIKEVLWHTYEGGVGLKGNRPPRSIYEQVPPAHFFSIVEDKPMHLPAKFWKREAAKRRLTLIAARLT